MPTLIAADCSSHPGPTTPSRTSPNSGSSVGPSCRPASHLGLRQPAAITLRYMRGGCQVLQGCTGGPMTCRRHAARRPSHRQRPRACPAFRQSVQASLAQLLASVPPAAGITYCDYRSSGFAPADRGYVCSVFARLSGYGPVQPGTARAPPREDCGYLASVLA